VWCCPGAATAIVNPTPTASRCPRTPTVLGPRRHHPKLASNCGDSSKMICVY